MQIRFALSLLEWLYIKIQASPFSSCIDEVCWLLRLWLKQVGAPPCVRRMFNPRSHTRRAGYHATVVKDVGRQSSQSDKRSELVAANPSCSQPIVNLAPRPAVPPPGRRRRVGRNSKVGLIRQ